MSHSNLKLLNLVLNLFKVFDVLISTGRLFIVGRRQHLDQKSRALIKPKKAVIELLK